MQFTFYEKTVSHGFREALAEAFPGLGTNKAYWRMAQHLLFGTLKNPGGDLMLGRGIVAAFEGKVADKNYSAIQFIDRFRTEVLDFVLGDYVFSDDPGLNRVRTVKALPLPTRVKTLVDTERRTLGQDRVWMSSGNSYLRRDAAAERRQRKADAGQRADGKYVAPATAALLEYLNNLPPHRFTVALRHLPEAMMAATRITDAENQLNLLTALRDHAQPFYVPSENTTRVFAIGANINGLERNVRAVLTQDWITADLRSAQLAIVAKVWGLPELDAYLRSGRSIWPELCSAIGLSLTTDNKQIVKNCLYAAVYGAGEDRMISDLAAALRDTPFSGAKAFRDFAGHPVVATLLQSREKQLFAIRAGSGGTDAFGRFLPLEHRKVTGHTYEYDNSRSILACIAQSFELLLLLPVLELAVRQQKQSHGLTVVTWLHDGFCFDIHHKDDLRLWTERLSGLVQAQADGLGISTGLEFSSFHS